ncbi:serine/threonine-protein kinase [Nocardia jejuensis]|uniref:serine/threonine-protein kinase n=1 Tax=Nocardia jejuensis TaxID=328049 RepID=UPI00082E0A1F|nr:serine/threonine-protein kinase [Nocardia jejuensis]
MGRTLAQGQAFAGYLVERLLGVGGMGEVYLARERDLPRPVALKLLAAGKADDPEVRARFLREADTAARLSHPNIVAVYARGTQDHRLWMAMQYIEGTDVAAVIRDGALRPDHAVRILRETARALDHAHRAGVLHRDVKPANILLAWGPDQRVYLADFGIAKALDHTSALTRTGEMYASFQYAAPEQFELRSDTDHRVDVYALGCTLFHMLTGQLPYPGESTAQLINGHLNGAIPRPSARNAQVPKAFDRVIARAIAKDRDHRFGSCGELAAAAEAALTAPDLPGDPDTDARPAAVTQGPTVIGYSQTRAPSLPSHPILGTTRSSDAHVSRADQPRFPPPSTGIGSAPVPFEGAGPSRPPEGPVHGASSPSRTQFDATGFARGTERDGHGATASALARPASLLRNRLVLAAVATAVVVVGGIGAGFGSGALQFSLGTGTSASGPPTVVGGTDATRSAAIEAACAYGILMTTYDYGNGEEWQSKVVAGATGTWKTQAQQLLPTIRMLIEADSEHSRGTDSTCTVSSGNTTHYELAADITVVNSTQGKADTTEHQNITMSMDYVDGHWLCSKWVSPLIPS